MAHFWNLIAETLTQRRQMLNVTDSGVNDLFVENELTYALPGKIPVPIC